MSTLSNLPENLHATNHISGCNIAPEIRKGVATIGFLTVAE